MNLLDKLHQLIPSGAKATPSGWYTFNAPCCHHRGHRADTKRRAGARFDNGFVYNCFNCKFSTGWKPGSLVGEKMKSLLRWLGATDSQVTEIVFQAIKSTDESSEFSHLELVTEYPEHELPKDSQKISELAESDPNRAIKLIQYLDSRGIDVLERDYYWSPEYRDRILIPFTYQNKNVGYTGRKITDGNPKYISHQPPHFVFNLDSIEPRSKHLLVVEGVLDAVAVNGVGLLHNEISPQQLYKIHEKSPEQIIVIPDQDRAGLVLYDAAIEYKLSVAVPHWEEDVKDAAEAVRRYGKLFVVVDAIQTAVSGPILINLHKKKLESRLKGQ